MGYVLIIIFIFGLIYVYQALPLLKAKNTRELIVLSFMMGLALLVTALLVLDIPIASPAVYIEAVVKIVLGVFI